MRSSFRDLYFLTEAALFRFCHSYDDNDPSLTPIPPVLKDGEKIHYPIFHDECCFHANDQSNYVWMREGEQPLRNKSRGRIVHVSDFVLEHCGRLCLSEEQIEAQLNLPTEPRAPAPSARPSNTSNATPHPPLPSSSESCPSNAQTPVPNTTSSKRKSKPKNTRAKTNTGRTAAEHSWVPPPPPPGISSYQLPSFDARRIIYPGANHDPWWDMPQLIAQVRRYTTCIFVN